MHVGVQRTNNSKLLKSNVLRSDSQNDSGYGGRFRLRSPRIGQWMWGYLSSVWRASIDGLAALGAVVLWRRGSFPATDDPAEAGNAAPARDRWPPTHPGPRRSRDDAGRSDYRPIDPRFFARILFRILFRTSAYFSYVLTPYHCVSDSLPTRTKP